MPLKQIPVDDILELQRREQELKYEKYKLTPKALKERGLSIASDFKNDNLD